ncbi:hypothetical protein DSL72_007742 [Monilinia vaccinii-corymbosi]|uniref:P-loop containing nucleoside triphosphate hydrolase protein n=1 Tax=Monilinia vaccinii-corymbosi TaxID=61207 RepID=A0A8A3PIR8_9HELO|nr:hypothetical protein DSL72_007742 [Monilinia vaccinii-corymbosi]
MPSTRPIFCATHPRACSTAFERVFMTRDDVLACVHEPFGDAFYFGPERLSPRYEDDEAARQASGFADSTFKTIFERIEKEGKEGKRLFIKDIIHYLVPPQGKPATIAPSLGGTSIKKGVGTNGGTNGVDGASDGETNHHHANRDITGYTNEHTNGTSGSSKAPYPYDTLAQPGNPTVVPAEILKQFHFTFLIRHPRSSIPSYYRCTIPPLDAITGFYNFMPSEAGYDELRRFFDFLRSNNQIGPSVAGTPESAPEKLKDGEVSITVIDADDLLDNPEGIIKAYCREVGLQYDPHMLIWDTEEHNKKATEAFEKWRGFHDDAINSTSLKARSLEHKKKPKTPAQENEEWAEKYGEEAAKVIRETVDANVEDYEYLKSFAVKV